MSFFLFLFLFQDTGSLSTQQYSHIACALMMISVIKMTPDAVIQF